MKKRELEGMEKAVIEVALQQYADKMERYKGCEDLVEAAHNALKKLKDAGVI